MRFTVEQRALRKRKNRIIMNLFKKTCQLNQFKINTKILLGNIYILLEIKNSKYLQNLFVPVHEEINKTRKKLSFQKYLISFAAL